MTTFALSVAEEIVDMEPKTYQEAINSNEADQWVKAIQEEMDSLRKNETWELVTKPKDRKVVGSKWVFKRKQGTLGNEAPRYKASWWLRAHEDLELDQLDVKTTFLHGELDELIYMQPPEGFGEGIKDGQVCLLKKSLYGLKQSPRQWYKRFDKYMLDIGFNRSSHDGCVYFKLTENSMVYLLLYVDDMLVACKEKRHLEQVKEMLKAEFEMKDLGSAKRILGNRRKTGAKVSTPLGQHFRLSITQAPETHEEKRFMERIPYASMVGSVMYTMVCSQPDLAYAVSMISRYMSCPGKPHWQAVKWFFQYLAGTRSLGLVYGVFGGEVSWKANLQSVVALSTIEAEYMAMTEAVKEAIWLRVLQKNWLCTEFKAGFSSTTLLEKFFREAGEPLPRFPYSNHPSNSPSIKIATKLAFFSCTSLPSCCRLLSSAVEECFIKNDIVLANRPHFLSSKHLSYNHTTVDTLPYSEDWRNLYRLYSIEIISSNRLNMFLGIRNDEAKLLLHRLSQDSRDKFAKVELKSLF
ncbi:Retrovirus-related Pol polyprotein from transposon TNT 1-94 [Vitis vinifera]|uniref:Retrovirus-related Pol polyprotein from transposon TNT 1-94 n=1 Tax=Vitis vinifera TaxID=29760 RepID=A0A438FA71_VITVI|nr:Retrovirus-related Pol polyprotein from transposon TNT 1-94 [Vitis vinifera]